MDGKKGKKLLAAGMISCGLIIIFTAAIISQTAAVFVYLKPEIGITPSPAPAPVQLPEELIDPEVITYPQSPLNLYAMHSNAASRTYGITLELAKDAAPVKLERISVRALHDDMDYGTVWSRENGKFDWTISNNDDTLEPGEVVTLTVNIDSKDIPVDGKQTQLIVFCDGRAVLNIDMKAV